MNVPTTPAAPPISQSLADAEGFGSLCNAHNCSNYHPHPVYVTPHFAFSANTPNLKKLAADFSKALKTHYDKEFDPRASTYKMPESTLAYGVEVGTWDDVCKAHEDLCSKSFALEVNGLHAALDKQAKANERGTMCIFMGQCHWWKVTSAATVFFRTMRADPDGKPMLGTGSRNLGGRPGDYEDNLDEDGNIVVDNQDLPPGASLATDPRKLPPGFRPNWLPGGKSKDPLWVVKNDSFLTARGVTPRVDPGAGKQYHILLGPTEGAPRLRTTARPWNPLRICG